MNLIHKYQYIYNRIDYYNSTICGLLLNGCTTILSQHFCKIGLLPIGRETLATAYTWNNPVTSPHCYALLTLHMLKVLPSAMPTLSL